MRIARVYPRLTVGGAEADILTLLASVPNTHMIVTHEVGAAADRARALGVEVTTLGEPKLAQLVGLLQRVDVMHAHTINLHPLARMAASFAPQAKVVETLHNAIDDSPTWVDGTIVLNQAQRHGADVPGRTWVVPSGIRKAAPRPPRAPGPLRMVEIRRAEKRMRFTAQDLLQQPALRGVALAVTVVGLAGPSEDPRLCYVGPTSDAYDWLLRADVLLSLSAEDTFGRVAFEALACGALPVVSDLPVFVDAAAAGAPMVVLPEASPASVAERIRALALSFVPLNSEQEAEGRAWVQGHVSDDLMVRRTCEVYAQVNQRPSTRLVFDDSPSQALLAALEAWMASGDESGATVLGPKDLATFGIVMACLGEETPPNRTVLLERGRAYFGPRPALDHELGSSLVADGQEAAAIAVFSSAVQGDSARLGSWIGLAYARWRSGDQAGARLVLDDATRAVGPHPAIDQVLARLG